MIELLTDVTRLERTDYPNEDILASGVQGCWGYVNAAGNLQLTTSAHGNAFIVWTEQKRTVASASSFATGTLETAAFIPAFTPDSAATNKVTVLNGKFRTKTSQYTTGQGAISLGSPLKTWSGGQLALATIGTDPIVAYVLKTAYSYEYLGTTYQVIDIAVV